MLRAIRALLWERWRRTRVAFAIAVLVPALYLLSISALRVAFHGEWDRSTIDLGLVLSMMMGCFLVAYLLFAHCERDDLYLSFPHRLFRVPLRTSVLTAAYLGYGILALACYCGILASLSVVCVPHNLLVSSLNMDNAGANVAFLMGFRLFVMGFAFLGLTFLYAQTFAWCFGSFSLVGTLIGGFFFYPVAAGLTVGLLRYSGAREWTIAGVAFAIACYALSWASVAWQRRGGWHGDWRSLFTASFPLLGFGGAERFRSPLHAQVWYEWRRKQRLLPFLFVPVAIGGIMVWLLLCALDHHSGHLRPDDPLRTLSIALAIIALCVSLLVIAISDRDRASGMLNFLFVRPMSTRTLSKAWLLAAARSVLSSVALLACLYLLVLAAASVQQRIDFTTGPRNQVTVGHSLPPQEEGGLLTRLAVALGVHHIPAVAAIAVLLVLLMSSLVVVWTSLWMGPLWALVFLLVVMPVAAVLEGMYPNLDPAQRNVIEYCILTIVVVAVPIWLFWTARRKRLITPEVLPKLMLLAPIVFVAWAAAMLLVFDPSNSIADPQLCAFAATMTVVPFIPVAALPLLLDRLRHG